MKKDPNGYSLYVFDLDGTLYDQPKLRFIMASRLVWYYMRHPFSAGDLFILMHFRQVKDRWIGKSTEEDIVRKVSEDKNTTFEKVDGIVKKWIYESPLTALEKTKDASLAEWIKRLRADGKKVVVLSDYPTQDKLSALGIDVDASYGPDDPRIDELKPSPKGLHVIMEDTKVSPGDILMIGDRMEKDGKAAEAAGVDHMILPSRVSGRKAL